MSVNTCARCGRRLKDQTAEYGPICAARMAAERAIAESGASFRPLEGVTIRNGYAGARTPDGPVVVRVLYGVQEPLRHRAHHSPDGFNWGYGGSGPSDLARSIIADITKNDHPDPALYQKFKERYVAGWGDRWEISTAEIFRWFRGKEKSTAVGRRRKT